MSDGDSNDMDSIVDDAIDEAEESTDPPAARDLSYHPTNAQLWLGEEEEYDDGQGKKLFVDGADAGQIREALNDNPDVQELYFAHQFDPDVVREFENRIRITLEVHHLEQVPKDLHGMVNVILRVPNWVSAVKQREGSQIQVADLDPSMNPTAVWHGQKAYPDDEVIQ